MGRDFDAFPERDGLTFQGEDRLLDLSAPIALWKAHQYDNAGLAVAAILKLGDRRFDETAIAKGLKTAVWPGRRLHHRLKATSAPRAKAADADLILDGSGPANPHASPAPLARAPEDLNARDRACRADLRHAENRKDPDAFFAALACLRRASSLSPSRAKR